MHSLLIMAINGYKWYEKIIKEKNLDSKPLLLMDQYIKEEQKELEERMHGVRNCKYPDHIGACAIYCDCGNGCPYSTVYCENK